MAILDKHGKPFPEKQLTQEQTAKIASLHQEFGEHPSRGLTPHKLARIQQEAERGSIQAQCDLFEDVEEKDGHIAAEMGKRKRAILGLDWILKEPRNASSAEKKLTEQVNEILLDIDNFEDILLDMADGIGYGFSCLEYKWQFKKQWVPESITHRPPGWFQLNNGNRNQLMLRDGSQNGEQLWAAGWMVHKHKAKSGYLARTGLFRSLVWPYLFKNYSVRDLAEFLEIYGLPVRLGTYPSNASDKDKSTLLRAVVNIGHAAAGIIPEGMMIDFKDAAKGGSDPFKYMIEWCEKTASKVILGGTLTSQADGASSTNALGNVHNEVRHDLLISDARQIAGTLSSDLIEVICRVNGWLTDSIRPPKFAFDIVEQEDLATFSESITKLVDVGLPIGVDYIYEKTRIPRPKEGEHILSRAIVPPQVKEKVSVSALKAKTPGIEKNQENDTVDKLVDQLEEKAQPAMDNLIDPIKKLVMQANSMEEIRDNILDVYSDLDPKPLGNIIKQALIAAEGSGMFESQEGI